MFLQYKTKKLNLKIADTIKVEQILRGTKNVKYFPVFLRGYPYRSLAPGVYRRHETRDIATRCPVWAKTPGMWALALLALRAVEACLS